MELQIKTLALNDTQESLPKASVKPTEQQICDDVVLLWKEEPGAEDLEITPLHAKLFARHPEWKLSEKRLKNVLVKNSLYYDDEAQLTAYDESIEYPRDVPLELLENLPKDLVEIQYIEGKGRGLAAKRDIEQGELIFHEPMPIAVVPPIEKLTLINMGKACSLCGKLLNHITPHFIVTNGLDCDNCSSVWCSRNCKEQDFLHSYIKHLNLTGPKKNIVSSFDWKVFEQFCQKNVFTDAYAVGVYTAALQVDQSSIKNAQFESLAQVSQKVRIVEGDSLNIGGTLDAASGVIVDEVEDLEDMYEKAFSLFRYTFPSRKANMNYQSFLKMVGKYNINQLSGQLYFLYALLNHDCEPNVHYERDSNLGLKLFARKPIRKGEELLTTYINPLHAVNLRRRELRVNYGFICHCDRCENELNRKEESQATMSGSGESLLQVPSDESLSSGRLRKSSMRSSRPDLHELLRNGQSFDLDSPSDASRTSVRFDSNVTIAIHKT